MAFKLGKKKPGRNYSSNKIIDKSFTFYVGEIEKWLVFNAFFKNSI